MAAHHALAHQFPGESDLKRRIIAELRDEIDETH